MTCKIAALCSLLGASWRNLLFRRLYEEEQAVFDKADLYVGDSMTEKPAPQKAGIDAELDEELAVFRALKPYIGHCLSLNHDINNPLAGIIGYSEFLMEEADQLNETQKGYLRQILECAERIRKLVEDLCEEKIALAQGIDLKSVTKGCTKTAGPLD